MPPYLLRLSFQLHVIVMDSGGFFWIDSPHGGHSLLNPLPPPSQLPEGTVLHPSLRLRELSLQPELPWGPAPGLPLLHPTACF